MDQNWAKTLPGEAVWSTSCLRIGGVKTEIQLRDWSVSSALKRQEILLLANQTLRTKGAIE